MLEQKSNVSAPTFENVGWASEGRTYFDQPRSPVAPGTKPQSVGVVGAGMMGISIAAATVNRDLRVMITDADAIALSAAGDRIVAELTQYDDRAGGRAAQSVERQVTATGDLNRVAQCDVVLESVPENLKLKQAIFAQLEPRLAPGTILASNTSTIPIARLAAELADPGRFCGIHFFHPVRQRPLVEIIRGPATREETIATAMDYARAIGKMPIAVDDGPGFLVNRLLVPYLNEALDLLLDGATIEQIEQAATEFGMAMGPLRLLDEIGIDTVMLAGRVLWEAFPDRVIASPLLVTMYKSRRLGRKVGAGFFRYTSPGQGLGEPDREVEAIIAQWARGSEQFTQEQIAARLLLPMILEATRLLEEGKVHEPESIDAAMVYGLGFPPWRQGLLHWADSLGAERILHMLSPLESLGPRMQPTRLLLEMVRLRRPFCRVTLPHSDSLVAVRPSSVP